MKFFLKLLAFAVMAQVSLGKTPARYKRDPNLIENTETSLKRVWEMIKTTEDVVKDLFKVLPSTDVYETAKENLRLYLGGLYYYGIRPTNCLLKVVSIAEEYFYLIDVEAEQSDFANGREEVNADDNENDNEEGNEKESGDESKEEIKEVVETEDVEDKIVENEQEEGEEIAEKVEDEGVEEGDHEEEDEEIVEDDDENAKLGEDEEDEEEEEEEDPASYKARLHVANLLKERSTPEFIEELRKLLESLQNIPTYIDEEMRSAEFKYSMRLFQLNTKTC